MSLSSLSKRMKSQQIYSNCAVLFWVLCIISFWPTFAMSQTYKTSPQAANMQCIPKCEFVSFSANFLRNNLPYPVTFSISDGHNLQVFKAVKNINTKISRNSTFMIQYTLENGETNKDIIPLMPLSDTQNKIDLNFYLFSSDEQKLMEPVLFAEEVGANIELQNRLEKKDGNTVLITNTKGKPGSLYIIDTKLGIPEPPTGVSCEACKPSYPTVDHVKSLSGQCTPTVNTISFLTAATQQDSTEFEELSEGIAGLQIAGAVDNLSSVPLAEVALKDVNLKEHDARPLGIPDYLVPPGFYIAELRLRDAKIGAELESLKIPIDLAAKQTRQLILDITDLENIQDFQPKVIGDIELGTKLFGMAVKIIGTQFLGSGILIDTYAENTGWILLRMPRQVNIREIIKSEQDSMTGDRLRAIYDYTVNNGGTKNFLIIKVEEGRNWYTLRFREPYFYFSSLANKYDLSQMRVSPLTDIDDLTIESREPEPFECVSSDPQVAAACLAVCSIAQNAGCACSSVQGGCSCECHGIP